MADEDSEQEKPQAVWEQRTEFRINEQMREIVKATLNVCNAQITLYRRKIEKLQYGS